MSRGAVYPFCRRKFSVIIRGGLPINSFGKVGIESSASQFESYVSIFIHPKTQIDISNSSGFSKLYLNLRRLKAFERDSKKARWKSQRNLTSAKANWRETDTTTYILLACRTGVIFFLRFFRRARDCAPPVARFSHFALVSHLRSLASKTQKKKTPVLQATIIFVRFCS